MCESNLSQDRFTITFFDTVNGAPRNQHSVGIACARWATLAGLAGPACTSRRLPTRSLVLTLLWVAFPVGGGDEAGNGQATPLKAEFEFIRTLDGKVCALQLPLASLAGVWLVLNACALPSVGE